MAIKILRVPVADCQEENFYLSQVKIWNETEKSPLALSKRQGRRPHYFSSQPIKYCISLEGTFFSALEYLSNQARQIARD